MKLIETQYFSYISGGNSPNATAILNACRALPDSAKVTFKVTVSGNLGIAGSGVANGTEVTIETTCGEIRKAAKAPSGAASGVSALLLIGEGGVQITGGFEVSLDDVIAAYGSGNFDPRPWVGQVAM